MFGKAIHLCSFLLTLSFGLSVTYGQSHLTEEFIGGGDSFDLEYSSVTFTPTWGGTSYTVSFEDIVQLPTSAVGGNNLGLGDDLPRAVSVSGGQQVKIFGQSFSTFWVSPNGYITFGQGDGDPSPTLEEHFSLRRVAALYTDLTAAWTGAVSGRQLYNRVAITWQAVPEYSNTSPNTFQIEMFFDGRIRLSWLDIGADECIVGLSNGEGLPEHFKETDFTDPVVELPKASEPSPADGGRHFATWVSLTWKSGHPAVSHDVYVGNIYSSVYNGTPASGTFRGNRVRTEVTLGFPGFPYPEGLVPGTTYYWRIDEVEADGTVHKGDVWDFSAEKYVSVPILEEEQTLDQFAELVVLGKLTDLTAGGLVRDLVLRFRGDPGAAAEPIYVTVKDSAGAAATVIYPNPAASQNPDWVIWRIGLTEFVGVDPTKAVRMSLGIGGDGKPAEGPGTMEISYVTRDSGAQQATLNIFVKNADNQPIPGATVTVKKVEQEHDASPKNPTDSFGWCVAKPHMLYAYEITVLPDNTLTAENYAAHSQVYFVKDDPLIQKLNIVLTPELPGVANDLCKNAALVWNGTVAYDTSKATFDGIEGDDRCIDTPNLWYRYTAAANGWVTVTLVGDNYSVDPKLAIYDGTSCPPTIDDLIDCNDDYLEGIWDARIKFYALDGHEYLIEVASRAADEAGPGEMTIVGP